ncbi:Peptidase M13 neprilysin [Penicillium fimorum]|uniref:Peptidase M13 neprilysin n=1 Tax=Penicillium fimorum TaxID=1882269 RepID=A0A9W9Y1S5_9EURO|nr:Peptidase M13 neprilysin [Penicillium fimorum]
MDANDARVEDILLGQDTETLQLLISTAVAAQNKRERATGEKIIWYRPEPEKREEKEKEVANRFSYLELYLFGVR